MSFLVAGVIFFSLVSFFIFSYKANKSTPIPEGMEADLPICDSCKSIGGCKFKL